MLNDTRESSNCTKKGEKACETLDIVMLDLVFRCTQDLGQLRQGCTHAIHPGEMLRACFGDMSSNISI